MADFTTRRQSTTSTIRCEEEGSRGVGEVTRAHVVIVESRASSAFVDTLERRFVRKQSPIRGAEIEMADAPSETDGGDAGEAGGTQIWRRANAGPITSIDASVVETRGPYESVGDAADAVRRVLRADGKPLQYHPKLIGRERTVLVCPEDTERDPLRRGRCVMKPIAACGFKVEIRKWTAPPGDDKFYILNDVSAHSPLCPARFRPAVNELVEAPCVTELVSAGKLSLKSIIDAVHDAYGVKLATTSAFRVMTGAQRKRRRVD